MRQMKDSGVKWIGEVPEGWKICRVKNVASLFGRIGFRGYTSDDLNKDGEGAITLSPSNMLPMSMDYTKVTYLSWAKYYESPEIMINEGDLLMVKTGSSYGKVAFVCNLPQEATINPQILRIVPKESSKYLGYYMQTSLFVHQVEGSVVGGTIPTIAQEKINNFTTILPPLQEQQAIASYLDKKCGEIDSLVGLQEEMIAELKAYKQSVITEAVTRGLDPDAQMKESGVEWIGEVPEGWRVERFKNVAKSIKKGNGITKEEIVENGDSPCVRYGEIYTKYQTSFTNCHTRTNICNINSPKHFSYGNLLFAGTGEIIEEIGKCIVYLGETDCLAGGDIIIAEHNECPLFMGFALDSDYAQKQKSCGKSKLKVIHISASDIGNILVALPPLPEQQRIATYLDTKTAEIDQLIAIKQQKITELKEYKRSLIYECVTGKKEILQTTN